MLADLLSSKPKSKLINLFLAHPQRSFSATELRLTTGVSAAFLVKTLRELTRMEFLNFSDKKNHKYYQVNRRFALYPELLNLLRKNKVQPVDLLAKAALKIGELKMVSFTGIFAGRPRLETDVLFVGRLHPKKLEQFIKLAERFAEQEINYTVFTPTEFDYRLIMSDRFIKNILENNPAMILDKTKARASLKIR